ncbi:DUF3267 domain-containing protein [Rummeliibacillus pycnus]|uniref:DUF3267 domain-containing protein n=1 Tax=Rummeliibacillus pycnus TaxID=101070 RepID=UPI0037C6BE18
MKNNSEPIAIIEIDMQKVAWQNLLLTVFLMIAFFFINIFIHHDFTFHITIWHVLLYFLLFIILYIVLIVLHECCHLLGFILFGKVPFSSLKYGVNLKIGVAYATTTELLSNKAMRKALLLPFWLTGVIPAVIGFVMNSKLWLILGAWLIAGAIGDFIMYIKLRKYPKHYLVRDDPNLPKLYVYKN